ncbi:glycosyltransferase family 2 protein, partial [Limosilactobacillus reuteri subsp. suis]|uniref:glycosyltransferase family 2 protein n=1 Tax=Limosilactobacillus reuteri TaxID=1598 RepID=UPI0039953CE9
ACFKKCIVNDIREELGDFIMEKTVSIIVPCYNSSFYLDECLKSLLNQSYSNIEIIVVDNGSEDNSLEICKSYQSYDSRIKIYVEKKGNQGAARNFGIDKATGDYLMFVDSDDYVSRDFCRLALSSIEKYDSDICIFNYITIENGKHFNKQVFSNTSSGIVCKEEAMKSLFYESFSFNKIYKASCFKNIRYPISKKYEDVLTIYKVFDKAKTFSYINNYLYFYVKRDGSTTSQYEYLEDYFLATLNLYGFLRKYYPNTIDSKAKDTLFKVALIYYIRGHGNNIVLRNEAIRILRKNVIPTDVKFKSKIIVKLVRRVPVIANSLVKLYRKINMFFVKLRFTIFINCER